MWNFLRWLLQITVERIGLKGSVIGIVWILYWFRPKGPPSPPPPGQYFVVDEVKREWDRQTLLDGSGSKGETELVEGSGSKGETELVEGSGSKGETELVEGSSSTDPDLVTLPVETSATECRDRDLIVENPLYLSPSIDPDLVTLPVETSATDCRDRDLIVENPLYLSPSMQNIVAEASANEKDRLYSSALVYWRQQRSVFVEVQSHLSDSYDRFLQFESLLASHLKQGSSEEIIQTIHAALAHNQQRRKELQDQLYLLAKELIELEDNFPEVKALAVEETARASKDKSLDDSIARVSQEIADLERRNPHFKQRSKAKTTARGRLKGSSSRAPRNPDIRALPAPAPGPSGSGTRRITSGEQEKGESHAAGPGDIEIHPDQ